MNNAKNKTNNTHLVTLNLPQGDIRHTPCHPEPVEGRHLWR